MNNHYVPRFYLRNWSTDHNKIYVYDALVPHEKMPSWKLSSIEYCASFEDLYTARAPIQGQNGIDYFEQWFNKEIEIPTMAVIEKVVLNKRLMQSDYTVLAKYVAAQITRTPAFYLQLQQIFKDGFQTALEKIRSEMSTITPEEMVEKMNSPHSPLAQSSNIHVIPPNKDNSTSSNQFFIEQYIGQRAWTDSIITLINCTLFPALSQHYWCIYTAADDNVFPTSDVPVAIINQLSRTQYTLRKIAVNQRGAQIILPLSPKHILFSTTGKHCYSRKLDESECQWYSEIIVKNAFRYIYSVRELPFVSNTRPRQIDEKEYQNHIELPHNWSNIQTQSEKDWDNTSTLLQQMNSKKPGA